MKTQKVVAKRIACEYKNSSIYGNPSYYLVLQKENGEIIFGYTKPNAAMAYGIRNSEYEKYCTWEYHTTRTGKIVFDYVWTPEEVEKYEI